jgi:hypothetical protein
MVAVALARISARARAAASVLAAPIIRASDQQQQQQQQQQRIWAIGRLTFLLAGNGVALILLLAAEVTDHKPTILVHVPISLNRSNESKGFFFMSSSPPLFPFTFPPLFSGLDGDLLQQGNIQRRELQPPRLVRHLVQQK